MALTTIALVKTFLGISVADDDGLLTTLVNAVDSEIVKALGRTIEEATATEEKYDSIGDSELILRNRPVTEVTTVLENNIALVEDTGWEAGEQDLAVGRVVRISGGLRAGWAIGSRVITVTYDHGYEVVPPALAEFATELAAFDFRQSKPGGGRLGLASDGLDAGGSGSYRSREDIWRDHRTRFEPFRRVWV